MCLLFIYTNPDPDDDEFSMVLVNVRDEFFHRPTKPASFWEDEPDIVGGRDQEKGREGGTWMAVSKGGRIAALLNILQPAHRMDPTKRGRVLSGFAITAAEPRITVLPLPQEDRYIHPKIIPVRPNSKQYLRMQFFVDAIFCDCIYSTL